MNDQARPQQIYFARTLLPELFLSNPDGMLEMLRHDADRYLNFLWGRAAEASGLDKKELEPPPVNKFYAFESGYSAAVITMPAPMASTEAGYAGLITRKSKLSLRGVSQHIPRYVLLELDGSSAAVEGPWIYRESPAGGEDLSWPGPQVFPSPEEFLWGVRDLERS